MIICKSERELNDMREACRITAETHRLLAEHVRPGITTFELDRIAEEHIRRNDAQPAFKGYRGFPATVCVAINEQVVHGIPDDRQLREGDIIGLDVGVRKNGFYGDAAQTLPVGTISRSARRLIDVGREALMAGVSKAISGNYLTDISHAIQSLAESRGYSVVRKFVGHGIGRTMHEEPQVPNFGLPGQGVLLKEGMTLAIEPMVNAGGADVTVLQDDWTVVTCDGKLSVHFEHTVAVAKGHPVILTEL